MGLILRTLAVGTMAALAYSLVKQEARTAREAADPGPEADLEARLAALEPAAGEDVPSAEMFEQALKRHLDEARARGDDQIEINAGALHREVGGYPGPNHRMPTCCTVMRSALKPGDVVVK